MKRWLALMPRAASSSWPGRSRPGWWPTWGAPGTGGRGRRCLGGDGGCDGGAAGQRAVNATAPVWRWLAAGIGASLLLAGCGSFGSGATSQDSPSPRTAITPSASPSGAPPTVSVILPVTQLPTENAAGTTLDYPSTVTVSVPPAFVGRVEAYGVAGVVVLAPSGWTGSGTVFGDTSVGFTLYPANGPSSGGAQMVFLYDGGCVGCSWSDASVYFPAVARAIAGAGQGAAEQPPAGLSSDTLGPGLIAYSLPDPEPGLQINGVAFTTLPGQGNGTEQAVFENLSLTLPASEHALATVILNALAKNVDRYLCSGSSGTAASSTSLLLTNGGCALPTSTAPTATPTAVAPLPSPVSWTTPSTDNCQWGESTLASDRILDLQGGTTYPQWNSYYQMTAGWWQAAGVDLQGLCGTVPEPIAAACEADLMHFEQAYASHENAAQTASQTGIADNTAQDQAWNQTWMSNYARLERIFESTGCAQPVGGGAPPATGPPF